MGWRTTKSLLSALLLNQALPGNAFDQDKAFVQQYGLNCGRLKQDLPKLNRIVNGDIADITDFPWQVWLSNWSDHPRKIYCGGSIIAPYWILTAGHCLYGGVPSYTYIYYQSGGVSNPDPTIKQNQAKRFITHDLYDGSFSQVHKYDVGLVELTEAIDFSDPSIFAVPICLPAQDYCLERGTKVTVSGYGWTSSNGPVADQLMYADVPVMSEAECEAKSSYTPIINFNNEFCSGGQNKDSCAGDSGGPLTHRNEGTETSTIVGLVSWGIGCNEVQHPGVYVKLTTFLGWIKEQSGVTNVHNDYDNPTSSRCDMSYYNHGRGVNADDTRVPTEADWIDDGTTSGDDGGDGGNSGDDNGDSSPDPTVPPAPIFDWLAATQDLFADGLARATLMGCIDTMAKRLKENRVVYFQNTGSKFCSTTKFNEKSWPRAEYISSLEQIRASIVKRKKTKVRTRSQCLTSTGSLNDGAPTWKKCAKKKTVAQSWRTNEDGNLINQQTGKCICTKYMKKNKRRYGMSCDVGHARCDKFL